jgi:hypothetical protein
VSELTTPEAQRAGMFIVMKRKRSFLRPIRWGEGGRRPGEGIASFRDSSVVRDARSSAINLEPDNHTIKHVDDWFLGTSKWKVVIICKSILHL